MSFTKIDEQSGCWLWTGSKTHNGYGELNVDRRARRVHRLSYELLHGSIPTGEFVCHSCDVRACWNPAHLFCGTAQDNSSDMKAKGRHRPAPQRGGANGNALVDEEAVRRIRLDQRPLKTIAAELGLHFTTVSDIRRRKSWRHVE
ncbi:HNH endonuclease signature motif containing protein [Chelatococcus sp.]|uniref:HNH endonuclease signature motif containing protein n=1 Tax=Chelatococcus sp. TaxID=1953771 RepID=UPI00344C5507